MSCSRPCARTPPHSSTPVRSSSQNSPTCSPGAATRQLAAIGNTPRAVLADYLEVVELVEPVESPRVARDPDDDQVLAAALSARADVIVSGDADLLTLGSFQNIRILAPRDALAMLAERSG